MGVDNSALQPEESEQAPAAVRAKWERPVLHRLMTNEALGGDSAAFPNDDTFSTNDGS